MITNLKSTAEIRSIISDSTYLYLNLILHTVVSKGHYIFLAQYQFLRRCHKTTIEELH